VLGALAARAPLGMVPMQLWHPEAGFPALAAVAHGEGPLLELPATAALPGRDPTPIVARHAQAMYRSIGHWRPLVNGYSSYFPAGFPRRMELANRLPDDPVALDALVRETGLATVLVHLHALPPEERRRWLAPATGGLRRIAADDGHLVFAVAPR
jgi:hypothetical protein